MKGFEFGATLTPIYNKEVATATAEEVRNGSEVDALISLTYGGSQNEADIKVMRSGVGLTIASVRTGTLTEEAKNIIEGGNYNAKIINAVGKKLTIALKEEEKLTKKVTSSTKLLSESSQLLEDKKKEFGEEFIAERVSYLKEHGITEKDKLFAPVMCLIRKQDKDMERPKKLYIHKGKGESIIKRMLRNATLGDAVILEGPRSVGKNVAWESIGWLLNRPIETINCSKKMTKADILGILGTDATAKDRITTKGIKAFGTVIKEFVASLFIFWKKEGKMETEENQEAVDFVHSVLKCISPDVKLQAGPLTRALIEGHEKGTILVIDELNLSEPNLFAGVFNALTDKRTAQYNINGVGNVDVPKGMIIGGTQNNGSQYLGTGKQNSATMSRFNVIRLATPDSIIDILRQSVIANKLTSIGEPDIKLLDSIYKEFVSVVTNKRISDECLNVRGFERALSHIHYGQGVREAVSECVICSCDEKIEGTLVASLNSKTVSDINGTYSS